MIEQGTIPQESSDVTGGAEGSSPRPLSNDERGMQNDAGASESLNPPSSFLMHHMANASSLKPGHPSLIRHLTHDYSVLGLFAVVMGHASLLCLIAWLGTRHPLLTAWFLFSIAGFAAALLGVITDSWAGRRDPIALFAGLFLNLLPLVVYLLLRMGG